MSGITLFHISVNFRKQFQVNLYSVDCGSFIFSILLSFWCLIFPPYTETEQLVIFFCCDGYIVQKIVKWWGKDMLIFIAFLRYRRYVYVKRILCSMCSYNMNNTTRKGCQLTSDKTLLICLYVSEMFCVGIWLYFSIFGSTEKGFVLPSFMYCVMSWICKQSICTCLSLFDFLSFTHCFCTRLYFFWATNIQYTTRSLQEKIPFKKS